MADSPFTTLANMTGTVVQALDGAHDCGVTVVHDSRPVTLSYTSDLAALNDESQYSLGVGPCLDALDAQTDVECRDLTAETRWGEYPLIAAALGLRSVLAIPLEGSLGALNLYSYRPDGFTGDDRRGAAEFAGLLGTAILAASRISAAAESAERLRAALRRRADIEQAVGVLMAQNGVGYPEAFDILLRTSREQGEGIYTAVARIRGRVGREY